MATIIDQCVDYDIPFSYCSLFALTALGYIRSKVKYKQVHLYNT